MEILLATPINKTHYSVPPLGLGYLASALRNANFHSLSILDSAKENLDYNGFSMLLKKNKPRVLGIQCYSFDVPSVNRMLNIAKGINPRMITVIGGPHPTAVSGSVFSEFDNLDFAIRCEGEKSLPLLLRAVLNEESFNNIPGLVFKDKDGIAAIPSDFIKDLDSLGMPAWDLIDPSSYPDEVQGAFYKSFPVAPIVTSRGCPYNCTFCANKIMMGTGLRFRDIEKVINEIEYLTSRHRVKEFHILDDNFTVSKKRVLEFCKRIKEKKLKIDIAFPNGVRLDSIDDEILRALKEIGTYSITAGIESGSQRILDHMKKKLTLDLIREKISLIKRLGFNVSSFFIIGYPQETKKDITDTIRFARELPIDIAHFSCFLPLPGTEITKDLLNSGRLKNINYEELFYSKAPFSPEGITQKELKNFQKKAFLLFYLRPRILFGMILRLKSFRHFRSILKRAKDYIFANAGSSNE
jgi:radical SAM superfamily enzyme YgiQ (UPF0313 family)